MDKRPNLYHILREDQENHPLAECAHRRILDRITRIFSKKPTDQTKNKKQKEVSL